MKPCGVVLGLPLAADPVNVQLRSSFEADNLCQDYLAAMQQS